MRTLFVIESAKAMSEEDVDDLCELFMLLEKRYHFIWSRSSDSKWVRSLADKMENNLLD